MLHVLYPGIADLCQRDGSVPGLIPHSSSPFFLSSEEVGVEKKQNNTIALASTGGKSTCLRQTRAWLIAHFVKHMILMATDHTAFAWILPPRVRLLVLQHPSMHLRRDEAVAKRAMPPHSVG